jgi:hypothetical protein
MGKHFERLERFERNAERFARTDWNRERNAEQFARNDWNGERNFRLTFCTERLER